MSVADIQGKLQSLAALNGSIGERMKKIGKRGDSRALRAALHQDLEQAMETSKALGSSLNIRLVRGSPQLEKLSRVYIKELGTTQELANSLARSERLTRDAAEELRVSGGDSVRIQAMEEGDGIMLETLNDEVATLEERENQLQRVEKDVRLINDMMKDLSYLVNEQQTNLDTIESNITSTKYNVDKGEKHIISASLYQKATRKCMLMVGGVFALILVIVLSVVLTRK